MKKHLWAILLLSNVTVFAMRGPGESFPGLIDSGNVIALSQSDFDSGTYRIKTPGYYYFTEDVFFEPIPEQEDLRTDKPRTQWFTALSVESDNVIIDLNTKTFECTTDFVNGNDFKVFSMIELNNSPFQHLIFAFTGETELKVAHNVVIKNGTLGKSTHHGIHGNLNTNIQVYDLVVRDWEVAGIAFNGLKSGVIKDIIISGVEHQVPFTGYLALLQSTKAVLEGLIAQGDTNALDYLVELEEVLNDDSLNGKNHPTGTHDSNTYGLFINRTVDVGPIVTHCDSLSANSILIENVSVSNIHTSTIETVAIGDSSGSPLKGDLFGVLRWQDAYPNGAFAPNAVLKAQVYGVYKNNPGNYPTGFAENILSSSPKESAFLSKVRPVFRGDFAGHTTKGAFGIRVDCGHGVTIKNCKVMDIQCNGEKGSTFESIPSGSHYNFDIGEYTGNNIYGISLAGSHNCEVIDCQVFECSSQNGRVQGISVMNESDANCVRNCISSDHFANLDNPGDTVNPSSRVYGFFIDNKANSNQVIDCTSQSLEAPRYCYGFWVSEAKDIVVDSCLSSYHKTTTSSNLSEGKEAVGFGSSASEMTLFKGCEARQMYCENESDLSNSRAIGFLLTDGDKYSEITDCVALCNNGGNGTAVGILLDGADEAVITKNVSAQHQGEKGYGFQDTASESTSLFLKNLAYGNKTFNYEITYPAGQALPLTAGLYGNLTNLYLANEWNNISLERTGGKHYQGDNLDARTIIRQVITG